MSLLRPPSLAATAILCGSLGIAHAAPGYPSEEYEIKARILRVLGNYVVWPKRDGLDPGRPFVLGVLGSSPFGHHLDEACQGKTVQGRKIKLLYLNAAQLSDLAGVDLIFLCGSETSHLAKILQQIRPLQPFTVGDTPNFARRGVMLNLSLAADTVSLEINLKAAREAGFEISPAFLSLSKDKTKFVETE